MHIRRQQSHAFTQHCLTYAIDGSRDFLKGNERYLLETVLGLIMDRLPPLMRLAASHEPPTEEGLNSLILDAGIGQQVQFAITPMFAVPR